jgi:polar amino acid transport system substrate-binding protein
MKFAFLSEPPFCFTGAPGHVTGCDVELARLACASIGLGEPDMVETVFSELIPGLSDGRWQMTTGLFATYERRKRVAFSRSIWALADGFLVIEGNPKQVSGYRSIADDESCRLAVIRDQVQHHSALDAGVPSARIRIYETYEAAAEAVLNGSADAYASVARAHSAHLAKRGFVELNVVAASSDETPPAFGAFAFNHSDAKLQTLVNGFLDTFLGGAAHKALMAQYGFTASEIDLILENAHLSRHS